MSKEVLTKEQMLVNVAIEYENLNQKEKLLATRRNIILRPIIEPAIDSYGVEDAKGSRIWEEPGCTMIRQRSSKVILNEAVAEQILKQKGLWDSCVHTVITEEIDEDKLAKIYSGGLITPQEYDSMFEEKESFSLIIKPDPEEYPMIELAKRARLALEKGKLEEAEKAMKEIEVEEVRAIGR